MNYSNELQNIIDESFKLTQKEGYEFITAEHVLYYALLNKTFLDIIRKMKNVALYIIGNRLQEYFKKEIPKSKNYAPPLKTQSFIELQEKMQEESKIRHTATNPPPKNWHEMLEAEKQIIIDIPDLFIALMEIKSVCSILKEAGVTKLKLRSVLSHTGNFCELSNMSRLNVSNKDWGIPFTTDLTALAQNNLLEDCIGRDQEIALTIEILNRRIKNNPIHVGDAGVGKTAITEGLAIKIAANDVPERFKGSKILALDCGALVGGTKYRGSLEKRINQVLHELKRKDKAILYIDEMQTLISTANTKMDFMNLLKPAIARGNLSVIGAMTTEDYNLFEKDRGLSRRFQKILIDQPSIEETIEILTKVKNKYEEFHDVNFGNTIEHIVNLSAYIPGKRPDVSISLMDTIGSHARINAKDNSTIDIQLSHVEKMVSKLGHIPVNTICDDERIQLQDLETKLKQRIFGQDDAIAAVVKAVKRSRAGFRAESKPIANLLFVGATGTGKTELARQLSELLGIKIIRFDMSEYGEKHSVSRLIGAPPGYVGYEEGGQLINAIRSHPHALLLLDEIEKAHSDIFNILLQVMDYATLDNQNKQTDFRNIILIMTSNAGARDIGNGRLIGFGDRVQDDSAINDEVRKIFTPEFRNRLDAVVSFGPLSRNIMKNIVRKELDAFSSQLAEKNVTLIVTDSCINKLAEDGYSKEFGARNVSRLIDEKIKDNFLDEILFGELREGGSAVVDWRGEYCMDIQEKQHAKKNLKKLISAV
ncbi:MAG: AAA family ATPase [Treponema sp.]|nr:AAA family ATPase [Treponema sp.]